MNVHNAYDHALRLLFSHPTMLVTLLKYYLREPWVNEIDFTTLQPLNVKHVTETLRTRENDLIWRIKVKSEWVYLLFMLEFQSNIDDLMSLRVVTYSGLVLLDVVKQQKKEKPKRKEQRLQKLPPVFTLVFYTGQKPWKAPTQLTDCFHEAIPASLIAYQPNIKYKVLDVGRVPLEQYSLSEEDLVSSFIRLERAKTAEEVNVILTKLSFLLEGLDSLRRAFSIYIARAAELPKRIPGTALDQLEEGNMLKENFDKIFRDCYLEGKQEGLQEGKREGLQEGKREGLQEGKREGLQEGKREGLQEGKREGLQEGKQQSLKEIIYKMLVKNHGNVPQQLMARLERSSLQELQKWLDKIIDEELSRNSDAEELGIFS